MKQLVFTVSPSTTVREAAHLVIEKHVGTLPVVDEDGILVGIVRDVDLGNVFMPDFMSLMDNIEFVHDFGAKEDLQAHDISQVESLTMENLMRPPTMVDEDSGLLYTVAIMIKGQLRDMPVVDKEGRLVGLASRVDILVALLSTWMKD
jgi:CBS domain-containing protein